jgi:hypothetical protein
MERIKVCVYISGGNLQGATSNFKDVDLIVIDADNLRDEMSRKQIEGLWNKETETTPFNIY